MDIHIYMYNIYIYIYTCVYIYMYFQLYIYIYTFLIIPIYAPMIATKCNAYIECDSMWQYPYGSIDTKRLKDETNHPRLTYIVIIYCGWLRIPTSPTGWFFRPINNGMFTTYQLVQDFFQPCFVHLAAGDLRQCEVWWHAEPPMPAQRVFQTYSLFYHRDLTIKNGGLTINNCDLSINNGDFINKHGDLSIKTRDFINWFDVVFHQFMV